MKKPIIFLNFILSYSCMVEKPQLYQELNLLIDDALDISTNFDSVNQSIELAPLHKNQPHQEERIFNFDLHHFSL